MLVVVVVVCFFLLLLSLLQHPLKSDLVSQEFLFLDSLSDKMFAHDGLPLTDEFRVSLTGLFISQLLLHYPVQLSLALLQLVPLMAQILIILTELVNVFNRLSDLGQ